MELGSLMKKETEPQRRSQPEPLWGKDGTASADGSLMDVDEHCQAQSQLVESERRLATLMGNLPGMAYRCLNDEFWTMAFVSEGCLELTGLRSDQLVQNRRASYAELIHPEDRVRVRDIILARLAKHERFSLTYRILTASGEEKWVLEKGQGVYADQGDLIALEGFITDITDRRRAEEALRQSEEKFRLTFQTSPDAINLNRLADGMYVDINEGFTKLTGFTREDAIGKTSLELSIWADPADRDRLVAGLRDRECIENFEARFRRKDGQVGTGLMSARVLHLNQEDLILSITRDITERKQIDEKLIETERKYRELAESLPQVIFEVDSSGNLVYLNRTGYELFGYTREDLSRGFNVLEAFVPEDRERVARDIMLNVQGQKLSRQEYTAVKKDGTRFPVGVHASRVLREQTATGVRGILIDFTPTKRAEEEKKKLEIQLQQAQKMEAIGVLAGGIAHDFNNILSAIIGYSELAMLNEGAEHCAAELNEALKAANRAKDLVKQILAFSRQTDEDRMPVRVALVAKEAVKFLRATIPATIEIRTRIDERSGAVLANSVELHQIIMNLCTNAQHAIGQQAGVLEAVVQDAEIELAPKNDLIDLEAGSYVRISVKDTGDGMSPEVMKRIFDPYFTTKEKGVGTGLGLAVVHGIVKKYGGSIKVESEQGKGTTFHIYLPKAAITAPVQAEQANPLLGGSERILFVDDEKMLVDIGQQALQRLGYEVVSRTSPVEALELFKAKPDFFDLVISDKTMPGMTGDALAKELRDIRPGLPVIICTGYSQVIDQERAKQIGIKAFVMKPILIHELAAAVRQALKKD
jgi:PAS domain S-box-containing protein